MEDDVPDVVEDMLVSKIKPENLRPGEVMVELMKRRREDLQDYLSDVTKARMNNTALPVLDQHSRHALNQVFVAVAFRRGDEAAHKLMKCWHDSSLSIKL